MGFFDIFSHFQRLLFIDANVHLARFAKHCRSVTHCALDWEACVIPAFAPQSIDKRYYSFFAETIINILTLGWPAGKLSFSKPAATIRAGVLNMQKTELNLNLLVVFDAILRHGSVSQAAHQLSMSQGTASNALKRLRAHFGDPLFLKTLDGIRPTNRALTLAPNIADVLERARLLSESPKPIDPGALRQKITIAMQDMAELSLVPRLLPRIREQAPHCVLQAVDVLDVELSGALESGKIDMAIAAPARFGGDVCQQKLFEHRFVVLANRANPLSDRIDLENFAQGDHIVVENSSVNRLRLDIQLNIVYISAHWLSVPYLVALHPMRLAIVPEILAQQAEKLGLGKLLLPDFPLPTIEIFQYWHKRVDTDPVNKWLRKLIHATLFRNLLTLPME